VEKYKVYLTSSAEKTLRNLPKKDIRRIIAKLESLSIDPYPDGCRKLSGEEDTYRVRAGIYRIIYELNSGELIVIVLKIGHRKDVY